MHTPFTKEQAEKEFTETLQLKFRSKEALDEFIGRYLDGNGEQSIQCYTESTTVDGTWDSKISWHWDEPVMFINVDEYE